MSKRKNSLKLYLNGVEIGSFGKLITNNSSCPYNKISEEVHLSKIKM